MTSTFEPDADWLGYVANPRKPQYKLPAGSVDAHCHVFGPGDVFPYAPERKYTPADAPKEKLFELHDFLGFDRSVIVQATCHGADNRALVHALRTAGDSTAGYRARGVATIRPGVGRDELADMHEAGVRGVRFNFVRRLADPKPDDYYRGLVDLIAEFGWHIVIYFEAPDLEERWDLFTSLPTTIVVDHMGRPDVTKPLDGPGFTLFQKFMREHGNVWAKLSGAERLTKSGPPGYDDVVPFARHLAQTFPDRVIWGTDWPHPNMKSFMPDEGDQVDLIPRIAPDDDLQRKLLVDNPMRLYWEAS
jgi:2-pyrone-4,6-dicarboxylate lactonase